MGKKTKRQQPRPKKKRVQRVSEKDASYMKNMYRSYAKRMQTLLKDKEISPPVTFLSLKELMEGYT